MKKDKQQQKPVDNGKSHAATINKKPNVETKYALSQPLSKLVVFIIPVLLYLQTISFGFTNFDDDNIIVHNTAFLSHFGNIKKALFTDAFMVKAGLFYRPLQTVSFLIDALFSSINHPWMFHLSSVLLMGIIGVLLFRLLIKSGIPHPLALCGTLLFCMHPLFISSVAWLPARGDLLLTVFTLGSFLCLIEFMQSKKLIHLLLHWIAFTFALFCKETATVLPILFVLYFLCFSKELRFEMRQVLLLLLYAGSIIVWYSVYSKIVIPLNSIDGVTGFKAIVSNIRTIPESVATFFIPTVAPIPQFTVFKTISGIVLIATMCVLLFINKTQSLKEKLFYVAWFCLLMLPPLFFKGGLIDYLSHRFMLPLIGILLLLLSLFPKQWLEHTLIKTPLLTIIICLCLGITTFVQTRAYANPFDYYTEVINKNNRSALAFYNRGTLKLTGGDKQGALYDFREAITICPTYTDAYYNSGNAKYALGDLQGAVADFTHAVAIAPLFVPAWVNRGNIESGIGDNAGALADFNKALAIDTTMVEVFNNRAVVKANTGDYAGALKDYAKAIAMKPEYPNAYLNRGIAKAGVGKYKEAIDDYNRAIVINPQYAEAFENRGIAFCFLTDYKDAISDFTKAIVQHPTYVEALGNRSFAEYSIKDYTGAINDCNAVLQIDPNNQRALTNKTLAQQELQRMGKTMQR